MNKCLVIIIGLSCIWVQSGCMTGFALGTKAVVESECGGEVVDTLQDRTYWLVCSTDGAKEMQKFTIYINRKKCTIHCPQVLRNLEVKSIQIKKAQSAENVSLVLETTRKDKDGAPLCCKAPLRLSGDIQFVCPPEMSNINYKLVPIVEDER